MHELSLIQGLLEAVTKSATREGIKTVHTVQLVIGEIYGALPEALDFAFGVLSKDTVCCGAVLEIEVRELRYVCNLCDSGFTTHVCPLCGSRDKHISQGNELYIDYYEGD